MLPLQSFKDFIAQNMLFAVGDTILLAVSGGKDSVLMAHFFKAAGYRFGIAHCNFNLRADESQRDESFVRMLAATLDVPFHVTHFKTKDYAAVHKVSTQMAARNLRYDWFEETRAAYGYTAIALAQHQDDAIETLLLNLTRGTGIAGLHGILPKRGHLIRPLLFLSRGEIETLIESERIDYVEDSSNLSSFYARNRIRLKVVPELKQLNPNLEETFTHNIRRFAETEQVLQDVVSSLRDNLFRSHGQDSHISVREIKKLQPQHLLLFELLRPYGFSEHVCTELLEGLHKQSGTSYYSTTHRITVNREDLILSSRQRDTVPAHTFIHGHEEVLKLGDQELGLSYSAVPYFEKDSNKAFVDEGLLIYPLILRTRQSGDQFIPLGMKQKKKLSDFFIDEKVPLGEKDRIPLLINGNGELIWVAGMRQDNRYKVTVGTKKIAIFELKTRP